MKYSRSIDIYISCNKNQYAKWDKKNLIWQNCFEQYFTLYNCKKLAENFQTCSKSKPKKNEGKKWSWIYIKRTAFSYVSMDV